MTTNPPGNDSGTPIHDRAAASEGHEVAPGVTVPSYASGTPAARPTDPGAPQTYDPYGDSAAEVPFDAPLDAVPADEQLPAVPSAASAGSVDGSGSASGSGSDSGSGSGKADAAKGAAQDVAGDAKAKASDVAGTAKEQASKVASEATDHAKQLYGQASENLKQQAGEQQQRAAGGLRSLGEQLGRMAENDDEQGVASKVVRDLSGRATSAAGFLENRDPGSLLDEVKTFAAKRPGTFIAIAAGAGLLAGRLTKALATEVKHEKEAGDGTTGTGSGV
jgi:cell division septum initiation protein DivIVA